MYSFRLSSALKVALGLMGALFAVSGEADSVIPAEDILDREADIAVLGSYRVFKDDRLTVESNQYGVDAKSRFIAVEVIPWMYLKEYSDKDFTYQERYKVYVHESFVDSLVEWEKAGEDRLFLWAIEYSQWIQHLGYPVFLSAAGQELTSKVEAVTKAAEAGKRHGPLSLEEVSGLLKVQVEVEGGHISVTVSNQSDASVWLAQVSTGEEDPEKPLMAHACRGMDPDSSGFGGEEEKYWRSLNERRAHSAVFADIAERQASFIGYQADKASKPFELPPGESYSFDGAPPFPTEGAMTRFQQIQHIRFEVPIFPSDELLNPLWVESKEKDASLFR